jgi:polysaccharide export outer membrane protein
MKIKAYTRIAISSAALILVAGSQLSANAARLGSWRYPGSAANVGGDLYQYQSNGQRPDKRVPVEGEGSPRGSVGRASAGAASNVLVSTDEDYRIGVGDVIEVAIEDADELSGSFRVTASGTFLMHYLGRITALNKTTEELSKFIADGLRERYIFDPRVTVVVKQYNSRSFFVQGAVQNAGVYQIEGRPSLLELITLAGGLQPNHGSTAFIIRKNKQQAADSTGKLAATPVTNPAANPVANPAAAKDASQNAADAANISETKDQKDRDKATSTASSEGGTEGGEGAKRAEPPQYTMMTVSVNGLLKGRFEQNMFLEPGDIVNIPPTEVFFVGGDVKSPGSFPLKEGTTLRQALALAQGLNFTAAGKGVIFREAPGSGKREEIQVDFGAVMTGKNEDLAILPNDIVVVPNSKLKKVAGPILSAFALNSVYMTTRF